MSTTRTRKIAEWKVEALNQLQVLLKEYPIIAAADLTKVRSSQIHELRKRLRNRVTMLVAKNNLLRKAVEVSGGQEQRLGEFVKDLTGSNILLLTQINPFRLVLLLDKSKVRVPAKGGDIATGDISIPAGNTGIPPGPVIGEFGEIRVPTRIEGGSIWVAKDTVVASKGDTITPKMASVLSKLGIKPMEAGLTLTRAFDNGMILGPEDLRFDLPTYRKDITQAITNALGLSIETGYVTPESAPRIIGKGFREAMALATEAGYVTKDTVDFVLRRAVASASILERLIPKQEASSSGNP
jgi:large subunit ribosomal protein L10